MATESIILTARLPPALHRRLVAEARNLNCSLTALVIAILEGALADTPPAREPATRFDLSQ
jgi:predicted HicB family RNase H-like nuclease